MPAADRVAELPNEPVEAALAAHLRYVTDASPGIRRERVRDQFHYVAPDGAPLDDEATLQRVRSLAIPPAWSDVWICPRPNGHIQATGRDAKGRKQYRYHPRWRALRDEAKYHRMLAFGKALPAIRGQVERDLALPGLPREKVLAALVRLLETTHIRIGNDEYAKTNRSFGLTTLRNRHVDISGMTLHFHFRGKSGKTHDVALHDGKLARIVQRCRELPGYELFQYVDEQGVRQSVDAADVNEYLRGITGDEFSAKDFRTWTGTVLAGQALRQLGAFASDAEAKRNVALAIESVAAQLGNTPAICRKCYVHPAVLELYHNGTLAEALHRATDADSPRSPQALEPEEAAVLGLLEDLSRPLCGHPSL